MTPSPRRQPEPGRPQGARTPRARTHRERRRRGMTVAAVAGAMGLGVVAWFVAFGGSGGGAREAAPKLSTIPDAPPPGTDPRIVDVNDGRFDLTDRNDPSRQAGQLLFQSLDPLEAHHYAAEEPRAFLFLKDGRTVHIRADRARLYMPASAREPESGTLSGGVVVRVYEARPDGARIDPERDEPAATIRTESLSFDGALGRMDTPERVTVETAELRFSGRGMRAIFNQVRERLELLEIAQGEELRVARSAEERRDIAKAAKPPAASPGAPRPATQAGQAPVAPKKAPVETLYRVVFNEAVVATHEGRTITADALTGWARLIDGALPEGAIAQVKAPGEGTGPKASPAPRAEETTVAGAASLPPPGPPAPGEAAMGPPAPRAPEPLVMRWTGPCVVTPLEGAPAELKDDHVAMRFTAEKAGRVALADPARGATGECAAIEYMATTRRLGMIGGEGEGSRAVLRVPGAFRMAAARVLATFRDDGTVIHVPGAAEFAALEAAGQPPLESPMTVTCTEQADFTLAGGSGAKGRAGGAGEAGSMAGALRQAIFQGEARVKSESGWLSGDSIRAEFEPAKGGEGAGAEERAVLRRVVAEGNAAADAGEDGKLTADAIDAAFRAAESVEPGGEGEGGGGGRGGAALLRAEDAASSGTRVVATSMTARGNVRLEKGTQTLTGDLLDATLGQRPDGKTEVKAAVARGSVRYADTADRVAARCDELVADTRPGERAGDPSRHVVDLRGPGTELTHGEQSVVRGNHIRLDEVAQRVRVFGAGEFEHAEAGGAADGLGSVRAAWAEGMTYDDKAGVLECSGSVVASGAARDTEGDAERVTTRHKIEAERVRLVLEPTGEAPPAGAGAGAAPPEQGATGSARLGDGARGRPRMRSAEAFGTLFDRPDGSPARVESRTYVADPSAPRGERLTEVYYVEGARILADNARGTMDVPGAGKLLLVSQRSPREATAEGAGAPGGVLGAAGIAGDGSREGTSLFDWKGSMHLDRARGLAAMREGVHLTHQKQATRDVTNLSCDRLDARFKEKPEKTPSAGAGGTPPPAQGEVFPESDLLWAVAEGSVYMTSGPERTGASRRPPTQEMAAGRVDYDALNGKAEASAGPDGLVRFFDPRSAAPVTARRLVWDLESGHIRVVEPGPVAAPKPK